MPYFGIHAIYRVTCDISEPIHAIYRDAFYDTGSTTVFANYQLWFGRSWAGKRVILFIGIETVERHNPRPTQPTKNQCRKISVEKCFPATLFFNLIFPWVGYDLELIRSSVSRLVLVYFFQPNRGWKSQNTVLFGQFMSD